jgi:hypothetical protein
MEFEVPLKDNQSATSLVFPSTIPPSVNWGEFECVEGEVSVSFNRVELLGIIPSNKVNGQLLKI